jgi:hypothetical protein
MNPVRRPPQPQRLSGRLEQRHQLGSSGVVGVVGVVPQSTAAVAQSQGVSSVAPQSPVATWIPGKPPAGSNRPRRRCWPTPYLDVPLLSIVKVSMSSGSQPHGSTP